MLEQKLIEYAAPTLAGIKSANLMNYSFRSEALTQQELREVNQKLNLRGVFVEALLWREASALIYVYRKSHLQKELLKEGVYELLFPYGYKTIEIEDCLLHLKERLWQYDCFPHEIGVFLGYPLEDVTGFIKNGGRNCKCCGLWKVYCNEWEKKQQFEKLKKCSAIYLRAFEAGRSITQMTICA